MPVIFDFRTFGKSEAEVRENVDNLLAYKRNGMTCPQLLRSGRARYVDLVGFLLLGLELVFERVDFLSGKSLELVELLAKLTLLIGSHCAEIGKEGCYFTLFAQVFYSQCFKLGFILHLELVDLRLNGFNFISQHNDFFNYLTAKLLKKPE